MVLEDSVVFHPDFKTILSTFTQAVPDDWQILHLGGTALFAPPEAATKDYYKIRGASRSWGCIIRGTMAATVRRTMDVARMPQTIELFMAELSNACNKNLRLQTYAPAQPVLSLPGIVLTL